MSQNVLAGIGGEGGDHNNAEGGDVDVKARIESATELVQHPRTLPYRQFRHVSARLIGNSGGAENRRRGLPVLTSPRSRRLSFTAIVIRLVPRNDGSGATPTSSPPAETTGERSGLQIFGGTANADATAPAANDVTTADAVEGGLAGLRGVARTGFRV